MLNTDENGFHHGGTEDTKETARGYWTQIAADERRLQRNYRSPQRTQRVRLLYSTLAAGKVRLIVWLCKYFHVFVQEFRRKVSTVFPNDSFKDRVDLE